MVLIKRSMSIGIRLIEIEIFLGFQCGVWGIDGGRHHYDDGMFLAEGELMADRRKGRRKVRRKANALIPY